MNIVYVRSNSTPDKLFHDKIEELYPNSNVYCHEKGTDYNQVMFEIKTKECDVFILGCSDNERVIGRGVASQVKFAIDNKVPVDLLLTEDKTGSYKDNFIYLKAPIFSLQCYDSGKGPCQDWQRYNFIQIL